MKSDRLSGHPRFDLASSAFRFLLLASLFLVGPARLLGQDRPAPPATLELLLPEGATATADGNAVDDPRAVKIVGFKPDEIRRVKVAVTFADGATDERLVDVAAGQRLRVAVPRPGPEPAGVIGARPLVPINAAAVSADGRRIALGLDARTVVLWDTAAGRPVRAFAGHLKPVVAVAFSPDGKWLLSGSADATAVLWNTDTGKRVRTYKGHTGAVVSVAFSPDGSRLLTGSPDGTAIVWATDTGDRIHTLKSRSVLAVAYSPDGSTLGTASADATATLWDAKTGQQTFLLRGHREDVNCITFSPDGRRAVTGSSDDIGTVWEVATGKRITRTARHMNNIHSAAFTPDGRRVVTGEREEVVILSDAATGVRARTFVGHSAEILSIVPHPDGRTMLTGSRDGTARIWDLTTGRELLTLTTDGTGTAWAAVSPDGLFDGSEGGRRALGYRFPKGGFGEVDQYFADGFRPGLLAEVWRGERPLPANPLGRSQPPLVKLVAPKGRTSTELTATLVAEITDRGGGVGQVLVENNGVRLAIPAKTEPTAGGTATRATVTVPLAPGANRIGVRATDRGGLIESAAAEIELWHPKSAGRGGGRLYVVAVGISEYAETGWNLPSAKADAQSLAALLRDRGGNLFDRVDVVPILDTEATRTTIEDVIRDVAELSRPEDAILVFLCGRGADLDDRLYFAPHDLRPGTDRPDDALRQRGVPVDGIAAALGTARALNRMLVIDAAPGKAFGGTPTGRSEFDLRGAVERWGRAHGLHMLAAVGEQPESVPASLARSLRDAAGKGELDVMAWFPAAAEAARKPTGLSVQTSLRAKGFPVLGAVK